MYHAAVLADTAELALLLAGSDDDVPAIRPTVQRMAGAYARLSRPDGTLHLFNDSANRNAPDRRRIEQLCEAVSGRTLEAEDGLWSLPNTGYFGFVDSRAGLRLTVDCGEVGPEHQPGHAHCDLLSFELDLAGRPVVVDSGVHGYESDPYREYVRSTRAHNTVMIDGREQSEMWATFRVGGRAEPLAAAWTTDDGRSVFRGAYRPFGGVGTHRRTIAVSAREVAISDLVEGAPGAPIESYLHLHPDFELTIQNGRVLGRAPELDLSIHLEGVDEAVVRRGERDPVQGWFCPEFGRALPAATLVMRVAANRGAPFGYRLSWDER